MNSIGAARTERCNRRYIRSVALVTKNVCFSFWRMGKKKQQTHAAFVALLLIEFFSTTLYLPALVGPVR